MAGCARVVGRVGAVCVAWAALSGHARATASPIVDGEVADWPAGQSVLADADWLFVRVELERTSDLTLAGVVVEIDADADAETGHRSEGLGVDLRIEASPTDAERGWRGPRMSVLSADGSVARVVSAWDADLHTAPTHASSSYELRLSRASLFAAGVEALVPRAGLAEGGLTLVRVRGGGAESLHAAAVPAPSAAARAGARVIGAGRAPRAPEGGLRVLSWNVLWGSQLRDPAPFRRVLEALRPDVVLLQEWDRGEATEASIGEWLNAHAGWAGSWEVSEHEAWGVAVASRHPIVGRAGSGVLAPGTRWDFPVRLAAAAVRTPGGVVAFGSVHLKCCGQLGSEEDVRRLSEAREVQQAMDALAGMAGAAAVVLGGDFNLVGTPLVLDWCVDGLDSDGSALSTAEPAVLGDAARYTFGLPGSNSVRPRLDFVTYSDEVLRVDRAFVLETSRLDVESLGAMRLQAGDSHASDHLPVVVDLVWR